MMISGWNSLKVSSFRKVLYFFPVLLRIWCVIFRRFIISREFRGKWIYDPLRRGRNSTLPISHILEFLKRKFLLATSSCFRPVSERLRFDFRFFFGMKRLFRPKVSATKTGKVVCCRIKARSLVGSSEIRSNDYHNLLKEFECFWEFASGSKNVTIQNIKWYDMTPPQKYLAKISWHLPGSFSSCNDARSIRGVTF